MSAGAKIKRRKQIVDLFNQQKGLCYYCEKPMTLDLGHWNTATRDHVIPKSKGGPSKAWNIVAACHLDNQRKSNKPLSVFWPKVKGVGIEL